MFGDVAGRVGLDDEVEVAFVFFVGGDGRVGADCFFFLGGQVGREGDVLAYGEAEGVGGGGEGETVAWEIVSLSLLVQGFLPWRRGIKQNGGR